MLSLAAGLRRLSRELTSRADGPVVVVENQFGFGPVQETTLSIDRDFAFYDSHLVVENRSAFRLGPAEITYASRQNGNQNVFVKSLEGGEAREFFGGLAMEIPFRWSPNRPRASRFKFRREI